MKYKMMAVDIDGTLLDSSNKLTEGTKHAIRMAVDKGLVFTICTGRPIQGVEPLIKEIGIDLPFITYNGAMVVMGKSKQIIYEQNLSPADAKRIVDAGEKYDTTVAVWTDNKLYVNRLNDRAVKYGNAINEKPVLMNDPDSILKNGATKVLWYDTVEKIQEYAKTVGEHVGNNVNYHTSKPIYLEFVDKKSSKAIALEKLGAHYGIGREEIITVGDGSNDLSMIEYAGLGVAMANAEDIVKDKADYITLSNDEDGVAYVIRKFVLGNNG